MRADSNGVGVGERATAQYPGFDDYEAGTARDIAVFALEPR
jgi:hypothetical protein